MIMIIYILWSDTQWSGSSGCDVCSSCSGLTEHCTTLSSVILKILKSAITRQFRSPHVTGGSGSNYSIRVLKENIDCQCHHAVNCLVAGDIFMVCCAEYCRDCSMMTVQGHCRVSSGDHYTHGDQDNAASLMTWTTCETWERHMWPILICVGQERRGRGVKNREAHDLTDNKMALSLN